MSSEGGRGRGRGRGIWGAEGFHDAVPCVLSLKGVCLDLIFSGGGWGWRWIIFFKVFFFAFLFLRLKEDVREEFYFFLGWFISVGKTNVEMKKWSIWRFG